MATEPIPNPEGIEGKPEPAIEHVRSETFKYVEKALKKASKSGEAVDIAGVEITDPAQAYENLQAALKIVKKDFPFSKDDLYFRKFEGETVGEAVGKKRVDTDPIMLMHPSHRFAHVIDHELGHKGGDIENEGVVEAYTRVLMEKSGLAVGGDEGLVSTKKYEEAVENFHQFAQRVAEGKSLSDTVVEIYKLYYSGNYEAIYEMYEKRYMEEKCKTDKERDNAFNFFETVFPELKVSDDGWYKTCTNEEKISESLVESREEAA